MKNDRRHATGTGGGRLATEDRTGKQVVDFAPAKGKGKRSSQSSANLDPEKVWVGGLSKVQLKRRLLVGSVAALLVVAIVWIVLDMRDAKGVVVTAEGRNEVIQGMRTMVNLASAEDVRASAEEAIRGFMEARTTEERMAFVLPDLGLAERMEEYYARSATPAPRGFGEILVFKPAAFDGVPIYWSESTERGSERRQYFNLVPLRDRIVIEWESSVIYGEMSWQRFIEEKPAEPVQMRLLLKGSDYYNHQFADDSVYEAFEIVAEELGEEWLYAYVERSSEAGLGLSGVRDSAVEQQCNVLLRWTPGAASRSVKIEELLHPFWADAASLLKRVKAAEGG